MRARRIALGSAGALLAGSLVVAGGAPSYAIDGDECLDINEVGEPGENDVTQFAADGSPASALQVPATQQRVTELTGRVAGDGVTVAVLDSGVLSTGGLLDVERGQPAPGATRTSDLVWHQGTLLAGIIAGAPDADTGHDDAALDDRTIINGDVRRQHGVVHRCSRNDAARTDYGFLGRSAVDELGGRQVLRAAADRPASVVQIEDRMH